MTEVRGYKNPGNQPSQIPSHALLVQSQTLSSGEWFCQVTHNAFLKNGDKRHIACITLTICKFSVQWHQPMTFTVLYHHCHSIFKTFSPSPLETVPAEQSLTSKLLLPFISEFASSVYPTHQSDLTRDALLCHNSLLLSSKSNPIQACLKHPFRFMG